MYHELPSALPASELVVHRNGPDNLTTPMFALATASFCNVPDVPQVLGGTRGMPMVDVGQLVLCRDRDWCRCAGADGQWEADVVSC
jgi:hypothetical protein